MALVDKPNEDAGSRPPLQSCFLNDPPPSRCGTPISGGRAAVGDHVYASGLSVPLRLQQPVAMAAKEVQRSTQAVHLRGAEWPCIHTSRRVDLRYPARGVVASQEVSNHAHRQRRTGNAHELRVPPSLFRVWGQRRLVDKPEGFRWARTCRMIHVTHDQLQVSWLW
jgi:hypothetical protein